MSTQLELFTDRDSREYHVWLWSPPGTPAPWVVRERQKWKGKRS